MYTKKNIKSHSNIVPNNINISDVPNFSDGLFTPLNPMTGGGLFSRKKNKTKKLSTTRDAETDISANTAASNSPRNPVKATPKERVIAFINYMYYYNPDNVVQPNEDIKHVLTNLAKYRKIYEYLHGKAFNPRIYNLMPLMKYMIKVYNELQNVAAFFSHMYEYICIVAIYENILFNAMHSRVSNTFSVDHTSHVKYALEQYSSSVINNKTIERYIVAHNKQFLNKFQCRISITALRKLNPEKIYERAEAEITHKSKSKKKTPHEVYGELTGFRADFMSVPGVDDLNPPSQKSSSSGTESSDTDAKKLIDKLTTLYLGIINTKLLKSKISEKRFDINSFYGIKYTYINWLSKT